MRTNNSNRLFRTVFKVCVIVSFMVVSAFLIVAGNITYRTAHFSYKEDGGVDYYVRYNDGTKAGANQVYFAETVDKLVADYDYEVDFSEKVSGTYSYRFVAAVSATQSNGEKYWTQLYDLSEVYQKEIDESSKLRVSEKIEIDYQKYRQAILEFKNDYRNDAAGELQVSMIIQGDFTSEFVELPALINSNINVSVPLAKDSFEAKISDNIQNNGKIFSKDVPVENDILHFSKGSGIALALTTGLLLVKMIYDSNEYRRRNHYELNIKKILSDYDSIIVELDNKFDTKGYKVVDARSFDELLDAYNTVHAPIMFYQDAEKSASYFVLVDDDMVWRCVISKKTSKNHARRVRQNNRQAR